MPKVTFNPDTAKRDYQPLFCFVCNAPVDKKSSEYRSWFKYQFCSICCMDSFKAKFN